MYPKPVNSLNKTPMTAFGSSESQFGTPMPEFGTPISLFGTSESQFKTPVPVFATPVSVFGTPMTMFETPVSEFKDSDANLKHWKTVTIIKQRT